MMNKKNLLTSLFLALLIVLSGSLYFVGWARAWSAFGVDPYPDTSFVDLRSVQSALKTLDTGQNPRLSNNVFQVTGTRFNYPRIWLDIGHLLNWRNNDFFIVSASLICLTYFLTCLIFLRRYPSFLLIALMFSSGSLLGVERANTDILMFVLLFFAMTSAALYVPFVLITLGGLLKLFPLVAFGLKVKDTSTGLIALALGFFVFALNAMDLAQMQAATPVSIYYYGTESLSILFEIWTGTFLPAWHIALLLVIPPAICALRYSRSQASIPLKMDSEPGRLFLLGGSIYVLTFVLWSSNADYRLVFLMFCVPYLLTQVRSRTAVMIGTVILVVSNGPVLQALFGPFVGYLNVIGRIAIFEWLFWHISIEFLGQVRLYGGFHFEDSSRRHSSGGSRPASLSRSEVTS